MIKARSNDKSSTTWLYENFAGKFCNHHNDQDLLSFAEEITNDDGFLDAKIVQQTTKIQFFTEDFADFMAVIWMILLFPHVHQYSDQQRQEITEYVYHNFFKQQQPLIQYQDHLLLYRGVAVI